MPEPLPAKPRRRKWPWILVATLTAIALIPVSIGLVNHLTGLRNWNRTVAYLKENGQPTDFSEVMPAPLDPDVEYFVEHPFVAAQRDFTVTPGSGRPTFADPETRQLLGGIDLRDLLDRRGMNALPEPSVGRTVDFAELAGTLGGDPAADPVAECRRILARFDAGLLPLREVIARPAGHFGNYMDIDNPFGVLQPQIGMTMEVANAARCRALVELRSGNSADACQELMISIRLAEICSADPIQVAQLVLIVVRMSALSAIWQGLRDRGWTPADREFLAAELESWDSLRDLERGFRGDALATARFVESLAAGRVAASENPEMPQIGFGPGMFLHNRANALRSTYDYLIAPIERRDWPTLARGEGPPQILGKPLWEAPNWIFVSAAFPAYHGIVSQAAMLDVMRAQALAAIALERHFDEHGSYPETLDALPEIPIDIIAGEPMKYQRTDGRYRLYSIGWNLVDDGGEIALQPGDGPPRQDRKNGDWVWTYEPVATP